MILIILKSLFLGLFFTLPFGPIGFLCVRKILQFGRLYGFILGLSQVFVIFAYSVIAILSLGSLSDFIMKYQFWLRLIGGLVLIGFGIKIFLSKSSAITKKTFSKKRFIADFFSIAGLMLVSPHSLLVFLAFFAVLELYNTATFFQQIEVILGILIGSIFSWSLVCVCFAGYKTKSTEKVMTWINRSVGILLLGFGIAVCISAGLLVT
jgi:threonine/homoserine/homoserine lactone efflux protein